MANLEEKIGEAIVEVRLPPSTPWIWIPLYRYLKSTVGSTQTLSP